MGNCIFLMFTFYSGKCIYIHKCEEVTNIVLLLYLCALINHLSYFPFSIACVSSYIFVHSKVVH